MDDNQQRRFPPGRDAFPFDDTDDENLEDDIAGPDDHDFDLEASDEPDASDESDEFLPLDEDEPHADTNAETPYTPEESADTRGRQIDDIPVTLEFVLGQMKLTIDDLKNLAPGVILHIEGGTTADLAILCSGQTLGQGELVSVNGQLGIRVRSWSH